MRFNKNQKDGIAKVLDTIGTADILAVLVGGFTDTAAPRISQTQGLLLLVIGLTCFVCATWLRK